MAFNELMRLYISVDIEILRRIWFIPAIIFVLIVVVLWLKWK
jgi:hypothetical protein